MYINENKLNFCYILCGVVLWKLKYKQRLNVKNLLLMRD